eukprot:165571-Pleurochrysis_carterae.AAC.1
MIRISLSQVEVAWPSQRDASLYMLKLEHAHVCLWLEEDTRANVRRRRGRRGWGAQSKQRRVGSTEQTEE